MVRQWTRNIVYVNIKRCNISIRININVDEIVEQYPVSREEIVAVLEFASNSLDKEPSF